MGGTCKCNPYFFGVDCASGVCPVGLELFRLPGGLESCEMCKGGAFKAREGNEACSLCPVGAASSQNGTACSCPTGTYFTVGPPARCEECPPGRSTKATGAMSIDSCLLPRLEANTLYLVSGSALQVEERCCGRPGKAQPAIIFRRAAEAEAHCRQEGNVVGAERGHSLSHSHLSRRRHRPRRARACFH